MVHPLASFPTRRRLAAPRYLRVVTTRRCPLSCGYCHAEGDPGQDVGRPTNEERALLILAGVANGIQKVKFLGGEPLVDKDLPDLVRRLRAHAPHVDLSVITSGVAHPDRIDALFDAGLDRVNISIHGFSADRFARRQGTAAMYALRDRTLDRVLRHGRPLKLNFVWSNPDDDVDLGALLDWAAGRPLVVNVLDDLGQDLGPTSILDVVRRLRGPEAVLRVEPDPLSLDTLHLEWADGLRVEVKHQQLAALAPWAACATCPMKARCREGIHAVRLAFDGVLRTCMDRSDVALPLLVALRAGGPEGARAAWARFVEEVSA